MLKTLCQGLPPTNRSAVVIIPPKSLWGPIQALRAKHDKSFVRWMPHINLLYGFVDERHFAEAADVLSKTLAGFEAFDLSLDHFRHFNHGKSETLWLATTPSAEGALRRLQATLQAAFPACDELSRRGEFQPHLTVGQTRSAAQTQAHIEAWQRSWTAIDFEVGGVAIISRRGDEPFVVRHAVPFGQGDFNAQENRQVASPLDKLRLGERITATLDWSSREVAKVMRFCLLNNDESGSMSGEMQRNVEVFEKVSALLENDFDAVIIHGFGSDSFYEIYANRASKKIFEQINAKGLNLKIKGSRNGGTIVKKVLANLKKRQTHGSTCPASHPKFLERFADVLDGIDETIDLTVVSTSDGGFDGRAPQQEIRAQMLRLSTRCRGRLAVNLLVGSYGSPDALFFFTGDPDAFQSRILFSTTKASEGVLKLQNFDARALQLDDPKGGGERFTIKPAPAFWALKDDVLRVYWPEGVEAPAQLTVRRSLPQSGGRELLLSATVSVLTTPVRIESDAREMFELIARCFDDNPYLRDSSRASLNEVMAQLEALLGTRASVLSSLTASEGERATLDAIKDQIDANLRQIEHARHGGLSLRALSSRMNALNNARRVLKKSLREGREALDQKLLERELVFMQKNPDHWAVWLQPAVDAIQAQLEKTQRDVGDAMQHLSTRIRSKKSREDGQTRAVDRHIERLQERSRARHDKRARRDDAGDHVAFEAPARWLDARCPITHASLEEGIVGLPFVADRADITSGNVASGGQNVDRIDVPAEAFVSLDAARELMWGVNGQMASPFCMGRGVYNAVIPTLLGAATPAKVRALEKAIGWLCTGTSGFEGPMAEAIPGALAAVLGALDDTGDALARRRQAHALLRTTALFDRFWSYPYVAGTSVLDEAAKRLPLSRVWAMSLETSGEAASLRSSGCVTSVLAKAVGADSLNAVAIARGMFMWSCRNIARSILAHNGEDGRGGVEGIKRMAALSRLDVALRGFSEQGVGSAERSPRRAMSETGLILEGQTLQKILGPDIFARWDVSYAVGAANFVDAVNDWMNALDSGAVFAVIDQLNGVFERFDAWNTEEADEDELVDEEDEKTGQFTATLMKQTHQHFDILSLEAVRPVRASSSVPTFADERLELRRVLKAGETRWVPPANAALPEGVYNLSVMRFINEHSSMRPLRALLRLHAAGLLGREALIALRREEETTAIPRVDDIFAGLADLVGGLDEVMLMLYRAFAFVVERANGYADNQWAEASMRDATLKRVEGVLDLEAAASERPAVHYGPRTIGLTALSPDINWPQMDARGRLPKHRIVGGRGETIGALFTCDRSDKNLTDKLLCQRAFEYISVVQKETEGDRFIGGLHRHARGVLGSYAADLSGASEDVLLGALKSLVPRLAGRVRGTPSIPEFFTDCAHVLYEMCHLGVDTRTLSSDEDENFFRAEAASIRAQSRP